MCWYNTTALCTCQVPVHVWSSLVDQSDIRADCEAVPVHWLGTLGAPVVALSLFRVVESRARVVESVLKPTGLKARYFQEVETPSAFNTGSACCVQPDVFNLLCATCCVQPALPPYLVPQHFVRLGHILKPLLRIRNRRPTSSLVWVVHQRQPPVRRGRASS